MFAQLTRFSLPAAVLGLLAPALLAIDPPSSGKIDYTRDIRPILSDNCYHCHGPDAEHREKKLRLDTKAGLFDKADDVIPFVPGKLDQSEGWLRILSTDKDEQMPPPKSHKKLTAAQIELIKRWIEQGAPYQEHWSFQLLKAPELPKLANDWWAHVPIDRFIAADLEKNKLTPSPEATKEILLRRVTFDLTGLPPTPAEVDAFLSDTSPEAYERVVNRLLATPRYGEHMARYWLDVARYGDTHGLHLDNERAMWPYRDWVVRAFNDNLHFDDFTVWQLAGDLLPNATRDQQIASGFNRCNVTTSEGGAINEEWIFRYAVDRAETMAIAWMGLTAGCAVCHDHKFDPLSTKEFYSLYAFFNSAADPAMDGNKSDTPPVLKLTTPEQEKQLVELDAKQKGIAKEVDRAYATVTYTDPATVDPLPPAKTVDTVWFDDAFPAGAKVAVAGSPTTWVTAAEAEPVKSGERALMRKAVGVAQDYFDGVKEPYFVPSNGKIYAHVYLDPANPPKAVMLQWHAAGQWEYRANWGDPDVIQFGNAGTPSKLQIGPLPKLGQWVRLEVDVAKLKLKDDASFDGLAFTQYGGTVYWDHSGITYSDNRATDPRYSLTAWLKTYQGKPSKDLPAELQPILRSVPPDKRTPAQNETLRKFYLTTVCRETRPDFEAIVKQKDEFDKQAKTIEAKVVKTLVMADLPTPRESHVMIRGQYTKPGELVTPATPAVFPPLKPASERATRLDLAKWLVAPEHPLTARVTVNRFWQQFFGEGLVKTPGDFGAQGASPSHPELLDWLAADFRDHAWDVKRLVWQIVTSATYRQDSRITPKLLEADPENRLLARGPRFRLDGEEIRDNALYVSGLIDLTVGGKGVRTYQPPNIWEPVAYSGSDTRSYVQDHGSALYRRSLYTFYKRTAPPPSMISFDAPSREQYCTRRDRSDTPLQALLTMNDIQFFEASRALGQRMMIEGGVAPLDRIQYGFRLVTARHPLEPERAALKTAFEKALTRYAADPESSRQAITFGESTPSAALNPSELAAYTMVANVLLNMDEVLTKN
jgi:hypothetical protein